jgi:hypothetical protein
MRVYVQLETITKSFNAEIRHVNGQSTIKHHQSLILFISLATLIMKLNCYPASPHQIRPLS